MTPQLSTQQLGAAINIYSQRRLSKSLELTALKKMVDGVPLVIEKLFPDANMTPDTPVASLQKGCVDYLTAHANMVLQEIRELDANIALLKQQQSGIVLPQHGRPVG